MNRYEHNHFRGVKVRIDGEVWRGNVMEQCAVEIDRPPAEFDGNVIKGSGIRFIGEMERAARLIATLAKDPELKIAFRKALGLEDGDGDAKPGVTH